jgi:hypothetical protein
MTNNHRRSNEPNYYDVGLLESIDLYQCDTITCDPSLVPPSTYNTLPLDNTFPYQRDLDDFHDIDLGNYSHLSPYPPDPSLPDALGQSPLVPRGYSKSSSIRTTPDAPAPSSSRTSLSTIATETLETPLGVTVNDSRDSTRMQHVREEGRKPSFFCDVPECKGKSFTRQHDLNRHKNEQHSPGCRRYICGLCRKPRAKKPFVRKDKMLHHLRSAHNMQGDMVWWCSTEHCSMEGVNQEVHFTSRSELDQHRAEAHNAFNAITSESNSEQSKSELG